MHTPITWSLNFHFLVKGYLNIISLVFMWATFKGGHHTPKDFTLWASLIKYIKIYPLTQLCFITLQASLHMI